MLNLVVEDSSDFTFRDFVFERVNCGKKAHFLRVGKDSAGSHKVHESKFLSSYFQTFSGGEIIWQAPFPDLCLDLYLEHHSNFRHVISAAFVGFLIKKVNLL